MGDWWGVIKEPKKIPRARLFGKKFQAGKPLTREMEEDIDVVVEQEERDFNTKTKPKPKSKFLGGGLIRDGKTVRRYKGRD